ncbi:MAG: Do family serine endopeptidase [Burkholderiaceae bacterium]
MTSNAARFPTLPARLALALAIAAAGAASLPATAAQVAPAAPTATVSGLPDFTGLVETVGPAVVNIRTNLKPPKPEDVDQLSLQQLLEELMRRRGGGGRAPRGGPGDDDADRGVIGSGFILSADGVVLTNAHVVEGADEVTVTLADKHEYKARIIGTDARTDVAVLKIAAANLPFVRIGDVDRLKVGEWVMAIGSPFGLESTVTAGIVSGKHRETGDYLQLLQTDVAINPGNSGGPLINMRGEVVGINSQILSPSGASAGISFSIPIDEAIRVADQLRASGHVVRGRIGVQIGPVSRPVAESIGLGKPQGALVGSVQPGLPAEAAGIEPGDVITKVQGQVIDQSSDLPRMIGMIKPGDKAHLEVWRLGRKIDVTTNVVDFGADADKPDADGGQPPADKTNSAFGMRVSDLADAERARLHVKGGVRVEAAEGAADRAGLQEGDIVLAVGDVRITSVKQFLATAAKVDKAKAVPVLVRRGDSATWLLIKPAAK